MKKQVLILHGWGVSSARYLELKKLLEKKGYNVFIPDLPGFGRQKMLKSKMELVDYVDFVRSYMRKHRISKPVVIAHSFGGRIALRLEAFYPRSFEKMILTGVPVVRHIGLKQRGAFVITFIGKLFFRNDTNTLYKGFRKLLYFVLGEWDYYKAGPLSETFKQVVSEDLIPYAKKITIPVLLIWGKLDRLTPVSDVGQISKYIRVKSVIIPDYGHKLPYDDPGAFVKAMNKFL